MGSTLIIKKKLLYIKHFVNVSAWYPPFNIRKEVNIVINIKENDALKKIVPIRNIVKPVNTVEKKSSNP